MATAPRRGRRSVESARSSGSPGPKNRGTAVVQHHISLRADGMGAGTRGKPGPREHDGPEHGSSRREPAGTGSA